jgi:hypothetical protein
LQQVSARDIIPLDELLASMPRIEVSAIDETKVNHGNAIVCQAGVEGDGRFARIFNKKGEFLAVASVENGLAHPRLVLTSITSDESGILRRNLEKRD